MGLHFVHVQGTQETIEKCAKHPQWVKAAERFNIIGLFLHVLYFPLLGSFMARHITMETVEFLGPWRSLTLAPPFVL